MIGPWLQRDEDRLILHIQVQPGARQDQVVGLRHGSLYLKVAAAPVEGQANQRLLAFLAAAFGVPKSRVRILSGATGRRKRVEVAAPRRQPSWLPALCEDA